MRCRVEEVVECGGWRMEGGGWRVEDGGWRVEGGGWRMEGGGWRVEDTCMKSSSAVHEVPAGGVNQKQLKAAKAQRHVTHKLGRVTRTAD
jgi:hypothetical protein